MLWSEEGEGGQCCGADVWIRAVLQEQPEDPHILHTLREMQRDVLPGQLFLLYELVLGRTSSKTGLHCSERRLRWRDIEGEREARLEAGMRKSNDPERGRGMLNVGCWTLDICSDGA